MDYPNILTTDNIWIIGITQEPSTREYYLVFYHETHIVLDRLLHIRNDIEHMQFVDFDEIQEIGSSHHATVYVAKYKNHRSYTDIPEFALKCFKSFDQTLELLIAEVGSLCYQFGDTKLAIHFSNLNSSEIMPSPLEIILVIKLKE